MDEEAKDKEVDSIVIEEKEEVVEQVELPSEEEAKEFLSSEEFEAAKEHDLIKEDNGKTSKKKEEVSKEQSEEEKTGESKEINKEVTKEKEGSEQESNEEDSDRLPTFDEVKDDEKLLGKYSKPDQALYFRWKKDKVKRQEAEGNVEVANKQKDLSGIQAKEYKAKLNEIEQLTQKIIDGDDTITAEKIQEVIKESKDLEKEIGVPSNEPLTEAKLAEIQRNNAATLADQKEFISSRVKSTELVGRSKYENFDELSELADSAIDLDTTGVFKKQFAQMFNDPNASEQDIVDLVVTVARTNPDFSEATKGTQKATESKDTNPLASKAKKNAQKQKSSASVTGGAGRRTVRLDDLTADDLSSMSQEAYEKVPQEVRNKVLLQT